MGLVEPDDELCYSTRNIHVSGRCIAEQGNVPQRETEVINNNTDSILPIIIESWIGRDREGKDGASEGARERVFCLHTDLQKQIKDLSVSLLQSLLIPAF